MQAYAIGDIHGHLDLLKAAHDLIAADIAREGPGPVIHVGDLIDRGPDSRGVVDYLMQGQTAGQDGAGQDWVVLKGNHDRMLDLFLRDPQAQDPGLKSALSWLHPRLGGGATLTSYGVHAPTDRPLAPVHADALAAVPQAHRDWLMARPTQFRAGECLFVHAGIRPGLAFADQVEDDLVWIREPFLSDPREHGALIVHGHTALKAATHYGNRLNIDSSAAYGGPLSAVVIEGRDAWLLTPSGRHPLPPVTQG